MSIPKAIIMYSIVGCSQFGLSNVVLAILLGQIKLQETYVLKKCQATWQELMMYRGLSTEAGPL